MFHDRIQSVNFAPHTADEIRTLAVKKITSTETYDAFLHPLPNGLYDTAFGPNDRDEMCDTCGLDSRSCPGHFGYIDLPLPVYHPMFFQLMLKFLSGSCFKCHRLIPKLAKSHLFVRQTELLEQGYLTEANNLKEVYIAAAADAASGGSATEIDLQRTICNTLDTYCDEILNIIPNKTEFTKNLVKTRLDLVNNFIKNELKANVKQCPHCTTVKRKIRHEYNTRVYFKAVSGTAVKKAVGKALQKKNQASTTTAIELNNGVSLPKDVFERTEDAFDEVEEEDGEDDQDREEEEEEENEEEDADSVRKKLSENEYITQEEIKKHMIQLWNTDEKIMKCLLGSYNVPELKKKTTTPEIFFLDVVAVPPSRFRPQASMGEKKFENPQTAHLNKILWSCKLVQEVLYRIKTAEEDEFTPVVLTSQAFQKGNGSHTVPGKTYKEQLNNAWTMLQTDVNTYMDNTLNKMDISKTPGVRQLLEKKEGLFRKHMMGKRVNYACRSVISPDPFINTDEIGVPMVFASKLTYPEPVTPRNLNQLKQMVINGPNKYPGAEMIELENGRIRILPPDDEDERRAIAKELLSSSIPSSFSDNANDAVGEKKVYRHLRNGDVMLLNRQPTLHRPSIMAHKVKVLPKERTLRLHYANCKSYNADFDGDEMNAHFPQSELARAEAYNLVSTNYNYLSPKDGKPLAGLIQDHVVSGVDMTSRGTFFCREDYQQLIYNALIDKPGRINLLPPCIRKPVQLWSGKQVFSSVLLNILPKGEYPLNMAGNKAKITDGNWPKRKGQNESKLHESNDPFMVESQVIIRGGELMTGILDKTQYGSTAFSLIHCVYEIYGGVSSGKLLSVLARLFTAYLQHTGFTLGVEAILVLPPAEEKRREIMNEGRQCGDASAKEAMNLNAECDNETLYNRLQEAHYTNQGVELRQLDLAMKSRTDSINNKVNSVCMRGLLQKFPLNSLQLMVQSGAKGSTVNTMQISCLLGQIELEGRRPPLSMSGRSLPSFLPYDTSPRAGGFVDGRFLTGIRPQEYFFHCMAGREGLIDTAVKTSRSGYLQRCLIKHLEGLYVQYDMTVRDGDGSVVQFLYGDDSIDVLKCQFLQRNQFKTVVGNQKSYVAILKPNEMSKVVDVKKAKKLQRKQDKWTRQNGEHFSSRFSHKRPAPFNLYEKDSRRKVEKKYPSKDRTNMRTKADLKLMDRWTRADGPTKESYLSRCEPSPDPTLSKFNPACYFGAVSEKFRQDVHQYITNNPDNMLMNSDDEEDESSGKRNQKVNKETFEPMMMIKYMKSLVEPGEAVGLLASQSIGEPSTQMTLNTFHFAGRGEMNVTLGIPRLREILMTASENIKTPQMDVLVKAGQETEAKDIAKKLNRITLMDVLQRISVEESLVRGIDGIRKREFKIRLELLPPYTYQDTTEVTAHDIMQYIELLFFKKIGLTVTLIMSQNVAKSMINTSQAESFTNRQENNDEGPGNEDVNPPDEPDDRADLSDEDAENDGAADDAKGRNRRTQFTSYDDPENRQEELDGDMNENSRDSSDIVLGMKTEFGSDEPETPLNESGDNESKPIVPARFPEDPRVGRVFRTNNHITEYLYSEENEWCEATMQFELSGSKIMLVGVIEKLAQKACLHEAKGIQRSMTSECKVPTEIGRSRLKCEGVSLQELWKYPEALDLNTLYSNNIHKIAKAYGIEAGRRVLIKEVQDVFKVYGIEIDPRHLSLIADYMTYEGSYKPFNRTAIASNPSPFQKISYETSMHFLKSATAFGQADDLTSPSSRIVVGRVIGQGTGMVDLLPKLTV